MKPGTNAREWLAFPGRAGRTVWPVVCALALLLAGCAPASPAVLVPHENPATAASRFSPGTLFLHVAGALQQVALREYESADQLLAQVDTGEAHIPEALRHICVRYVELCSDLARTLDALDASLSAAERSLQLNEVSSARVQLEEGRRLIDAAREQLTALESATGEAMALVGRYGTGAARAAVTEAQARLADAIQRLQQLSAEYLKRLEAAVVQLERQVAFARPALTCSTNLDAVWVGEHVLASGVLTSGAAPLAARTVHLFIDGVIAAEALTDGSGRYSVSVTAPFRYAPRVTLQARFLPAGADLDSLQSASSPPVELPVRYYESVVDVGLPDELYPGVSTTLAGRLRSIGVVAERPIQVLLAGDVVGQTVTTSNGDFVCRIRTPVGGPEGEALLALHVPSIDEAKTGPAVESTMVLVTRVAPSVSLGFPGVVLMPSVRLIDRYLDQRGVTDDGLPVRMTLQSSLPLTAPALVARVGDEATQLTGRVGEYWVDFPLRRSLWTVGMQTATLEVVPSEPWHRPVTREVRFLVVNLLLVGLALVVLAAMVVLMAYVRRVQVASLPRATVEAPVPSRPLPRPAPLHGLSPSSPRGAVVTLYLAAARRVEALTGLAFGRTVTLREFLSTVASLLGRAGGFFARLTTLAEEALYSKREFDAADVARSRQLAADVEGDAAREAPGAEAGRP